ncbi:MAG: efflux RND transporter periplasmic adaptor subunit [Gemmatimonadota bacterium]|nr:efflux RND transporter periplasmic adaptor subunit [Gemmatimonadota bacterium]
MLVRSTPFTARAFALSAALLAGIACGKEADGSAAPASASVQRSGAPAASGGKAGAAGARTAPSITLAATDLATITPGTIEDGTALTGDLRPIETIDVRARIEGDLTSVYAREGQQVAAGQLLARFESSEQESSQKSAEADRVAAKADLANVEWTLEQDASLFKAGAIAERDYKNAQQAVASSGARLAATEARLRAMSNQARDTRVLAPASGIIDKKLVEGGVHVAKGAPLFTIVRNGTLELAAAVPARQAGTVRVGQTVHFVADARRFDGRVARVSPTVDPTTRSVTVYVEIPNPGGLLRGGTSATGRVVSRTLANVLIVPTAALRQAAEDGHPFVYRLDGKTINVAPVQLGAVDERQGVAQVTQGLQDGDKVIVGNVGTLGRGMQAIIAGSEKGGKKQ